MPATPTMRRNGPYVPLSAFYADDDAVLALEAAGDDLAELLFLRALAYCARETRLNGHVSAVKLRTGRIFARPFERLEVAAGRLVEVGLWTADGNGWRIRKWSKWNRTHEEIESVRAKDRARKGNGGTAPTGPPEPPDDDPPDSDRNPDGSRADSEGFPARVRAGAALQSNAYTETTQRNGSGTCTDPWSALPPRLEDLKASITAAGIRVAWDLNDREQTATLEHIDRAGISALINYAKARYRADSPPFTARAWLAGWASLPSAAPLAIVPDPTPCDHGAGDGRLCALCRTERATA